MFSRRLGCKSSTTSDHPPVVQSLANHEKQSIQQQWPDTNTPLCSWVTTRVLLPPVTASWSQMQAG